MLLMHNPLDRALLSRALRVWVALSLHETLAQGKRIIPLTYLPQDMRDTWSRVYQEYCSASVPRYL